MKLISWNVNGLRACLGKGFMDFFNKENADIFCIQETKMHKEQAEVISDGYEQFWFSAEKKGYSGTLSFTKHTPLSVSYGLGDKHLDEGRVITLEYENFYSVNCYVPNAQNELARISYRMEFEDDLRNYLVSLDKKKPVVYCGDLNVAHEEIDLARPKENIGNAGFSYEERGKMTELLSAGFTDCFRYMYPNDKKWTWWSYRAGARQKDIGWRIDYFIVSNRIKDKVSSITIHKDVMGSDHCPVAIEIDL